VKNNELNYDIPILCIINMSTRLPLIVLIITILILIRIYHKMVVIYYKMVVIYYKMVGIYRISMISGRSQIPINVSVIKILLISVSLIQNISLFLAIEHNSS